MARSSTAKVTCSILNAIVVVGTSEPDWRNAKKVFACAISVHRAYFGITTEETPLIAGTYRFPAENSILGKITLEFEAFHDDRCGLGEEVNAVNITLHR